MEPFPAPRPGPPAAGTPVGGDAAALERLRVRRDEIRQRVASACADSGRDPSAVRIVPATKGREVAYLDALYALGLRSFGESRISELARKRRARPDYSFEFIGRFRAEDAGLLARQTVRVHSVCARDQAVALDAAARGEGRRLAVLLQVNLADDPRKQGLREADALAWVRPWPFDHLAMHGIMVIGPAEGDPDAVATVFQRGAHLFRLLREELGPGVDALSMGMSEDFELAVRAGATDLRIGRYLADAWAAPAPG